MHLYTCAKYYMHIPFYKHLQTILYSEVQKVMFDYLQLQHY